MKALPNPLSQSQQGDREKILFKQITASDCRQSAIWLQSGLSKAIFRDEGRSRSPVQTGLETLQSRIRSGFAAWGSKRKPLSASDPQSGGNFLQSGSKFCNLDLSANIICLFINELRQIADCGIQIAEPVCNLRKALSHKGSSQIADCRKIPNYVRNRMTRLRGHFCSGQRRSLHPRFLGGVA